MLAATPHSASQKHFGAAMHTIPAVYASAVTAVLEAIEKSIPDALNAMEAQSSAATIGWEVVERYMAPKTNRLIRCKWSADVEWKSGGEGSAGPASGGHAARDEATEGTERVT